METVGEGLDHGDEPGTGGHKRPEHAFVERPFGAHRAHAGSDNGAVEGSAELVVQADLGRQDEQVVDGGRDHERDSRQLPAQAAVMRSRAGVRSSGRLSR